MGEEGRLYLPPPLRGCSSLLSRYHNCLLIDFLIDLLNFHMFFQQYPWIFHVLNHRPCLDFSEIAHFGKFWPKTYPKAA